MMNRGRGTCFGSFEAICGLRHHVEESVDTFKKIVDCARMPFGSMFADFIFRKRIRGGLIVTEALPNFGNGNGNGNDWHVRP